MCPEINIGPITIYSYGLMIALGILLIIFGLRRMAPSIGVDRERITDLALFAILGGVLVSYLNYVISYRWEAFVANPLVIFRFWEGGMVFLGGLLGGTAFAVLFIRWKKLPLWEIADLAAIFVPLGYAMGRIGCFFAGCCHGIPTDSFLGVTFPPGSYADLAFPGLAVHPTQLYSAFLGFSLVGFALLFRKHRSFTGQSFLLYLIIYGIGRSLIEMLRINPTVVGNLSVAQFTGLLMVVVAAALYPLLRKKNAIRR